MGKHPLAMPVLVAVLAAGAAACNASSPSASPSSPSASPSGETAIADLVTEEVEPGVERIRNDGAGHDLDERHPTNRYDMDGVFVAPDGTVWLSSSYSGDDNEANPGGGLVWALGQSETSRYDAGVGCLPGEPPFNQPEPLGVTCFKGEGDTETRYLASTRINAVAVAPDGTVWAVGADGAENGGLYRITPE